MFDDPFGWYPLPCPDSSVMSDREGEDDSDDLELSMRCARRKEPIPCCPQCGNNVSDITPDLECSHCGWSP